MLIYHIFLFCTLVTVINLSVEIIIATKANTVSNTKNGISAIIDNNYDYPGSNNDFRQIQKNRWLKYLACLTKRYAEIKSQKVLHPIALIALEGTAVTLNCNICVSPSETYEINAIEWYFNSSSNHNITNELIQPTQHIIVTQNNKYLKMYNIQSYQAGEYWCKMKDTIGELYYLHIDNGSEGINILHPDTISNAEHSLLPTILTEYNIKVHTTWAAWSPCSQCDSIGIKIRYGYCTLSFLENPIQYDDIDEDTLSEASKSRHGNIGTKKNLQFIVNTLFFVFKNKLPCKFRYIPIHIREHLIVKKQKIEMMVQYCKKKCSSNVTFEAYKKNGNIIERANNSAGIYSMLQKVPSSLPAVKRTMLYAKNKGKIEIKCPGNLNMEVPFTWKIGTKTLSLPFTKQQLNTRIYMNSRMHLIIRKLEFADSNIYSCWQYNQLAGTVKLVVTGEIELKFNYQIMMFGSIVIISVFTLVIWRVFKSKMRYTRR